MAKRQTNQQVVKKLMTFSNHGALMEAFIITAIQKYADQCIAAGAETFDSGLMHGAAWVGAAEEAKKAIEDHLKS